MYTYVTISLVRTSRKSRPGHLCAVRFYLSSCSAFGRRRGGNFFNQHFARRTDVVGGMSAAAKLRLPLKGPSTVIMNFTKRSSAKRFQRPRERYTVTADHTRLI